VNLPGACRNFDLIEVRPAIRRRVNPQRADLETLAKSLLEFDVGIFDAGRVLIEASIPAFAGRIVGPARQVMWSYTFHRPTLTRLH
jgi:hypothetical protein